MLALCRLLIKQVHCTHASRKAKRSWRIARCADKLLHNQAIRKTKTSCNLKTGSLLAAVERIQSIDPTKAPPEDEQARKITKSLDPRKFNRLILECEQNEDKYEKILAVRTLQQASLEKRLKGRTLVPCNQMVRTGHRFR